MPSEVSIAGGAQDLGRVVEDLKRELQARNQELAEARARQVGFETENARLFKAEQTRTQELKESFEYQTAISGVLGVISRSPNELQPVFDSIVESGLKLFPDAAVVIALPDGVAIRAVAVSSADPEGSQALRRRFPVPLSRDYFHGVAILDRRIVDVPDLADPPAEMLTGAQNGLATGFRAHTLVPMMQKGIAIGTLGVFRRAPGPLSDKQIALLQTFANQAVIAVENARLFEAEQARTRELRESLEYQTATSDVLDVISRSPSQSQPVLDTIVATSGRLCQAEFAYVFMRHDDGRYHVAAVHPIDTEHERFLRDNPISLNRGTTTGRAALERCTIHIPDAAADPEYNWTAWMDLSGARTFLGVPLLRDGDPIGVITLSRKTGQFTERQIELAETFADQAVIAINNARLFEEVQSRTRELTEALEYQTATSEVLGVISRSPNELQPVLDEIAGTAHRLCEASDTVILLEGGGDLRVAAHSGAMKIDFERGPRGRGWISGRTLIDGKPTHVHDLTSADEEFPDGAKLARRLGHRTALGIPLMHEGAAIGVLFLSRMLVRPFTVKEIALLETFADQAVIAINNVRLFEEVQSRTRELTEALEYQTATSEVLNVISRSPNELQPVLDTIVATAKRLCSAELANLWRLRNGRFELAAQTDTNAGRVNFLQQNPIPVGRGSLAGRSVLERRALHMADIAADPDLGRQQQVITGNLHTMAVVPLIQRGEPIGVISLARTQVRPFTDKQIDLVTTFADQAVIAISNVGLFDEVQARTKELQESLEYQTATSDVLGVISRSPTDVQTIFDAIVRSAVNLCDGLFGFVGRYDGERIHIVANHNYTTEALQVVQRMYPIAPNRQQVSGRVILTGAVVHIEDVLEDPEYAQELARAGGWRSMLGVPLQRDGRTIGVISVMREQPGPFTEMQIELLKTFADQAVIAIENARLFEEVQARTRDLARSVQELRALGQVGQTVSASLDSKVVLPRILEHACAMSDTGGGSIYVFDKARREFDLEAGHNMSEELIAAVREHPIRLGESLVGQCAERREAMQFENLTEAPPHPLIAMHIKWGVRALLAVPLLHQDEVVGALVVRRRQPGAFPAAIVTLMQTFANQSAIAVHNARLFREIEDKSRQLELASQHKSQFVANMSHELRTPLAAMLGYAELLQENIYGALPAKATPIVERIRSNGRHLLGLINTVLDISKIESGQFKLNLGEYSLSSMVETVRVATGSLAEAKSLGLKTDIAEGLPRGLGDEQRLTQVLLNLVGNAIKFTDAGEVRIGASVAAGRFTVAVSDTGPGIPPEERDKVFEKFHQIDNSSTRTKGGTGLGLAIAKDIVEMHGGRIWVESTLGRGATFCMQLPVRAKSSEAGVA